MPRSGRAPKDKRIRLSSFGACTGLLFPDSGGSAEIALAPLEIKRLLKAWEEVERGKKKADQRILSALDLLISKARVSSPGIVVEAPITKSKRAAITPDPRYGHKDA